MVPIAREPTASGKDDDKDDVTLALRKARRWSSQALLVEIEKAVRTTDQTYMPSSTPSLIEVTPSEVGSKIGE